MAIERIGAFIEVIDEDGMRNLVRITAIQRVCDVDEFREEAYLTVAGRMILIRVSLDEMREVLMEAANR
ncbi:hypothetical protein [Rhodoblastus sp.]|jgi:hypothetical protein|uniref:hypothetical protein n=1 Tax=Rhodoblastus sp. TaxID=1962975 RepID=UPI0025CEAC5A|nr:hypothetical protein [Rhodoblastus sp.]